MNFLNFRPPHPRFQTGALYALLVAVNAGGWATALICFRHHPLLLGTALLAYACGLRHAVDADHIAAIDNVTRKLMQEGQRPVGVGFFFSIDHSLVVFALSAGIAFAAKAMPSPSRFTEIGDLLGTSISALFLFAIAAANTVVLASLWKTFRAVRAGGRLSEDDLAEVLARRGFLGRIFRGLFQLIGRSWQMLPLGFLFGLGFDTATEVGLLGISAAEAAKGLSPWLILIFPLLFAAGMSLVDTTDGLLMLNAYGWAFLEPLRKLYYNLTITLISIGVALAVGGIELLGLVGDRLKLDGGFWEAVGKLNDNFGLLGYGIIGLFAVGWLLSLAFYRLRLKGDGALNA